MKEVFEICKSDQEYVERTYKQIYESFLFSLSMYGNHKIYRKKLLNDILEKFDKLTQKNREIGLISGRYHRYFVNKTISSYEQTTGEKLVK